MTSAQPSEADPQTAESSAEEPAATTTTDPAPTTAPAADDGRGDDDRDDRDRPGSADVARAPSGPGDEPLDPSAPSNPA